MVTQLIVFLAAVILAACNRLPSAEAKLVGSWKAETWPESATIFTFESNHTDWCAVTVRDDTWLESDGRWHIEGKQIVFDIVSYPKVYTAAFEQVDHDTIKLDGVVFTRTDRSPKPKRGPFSF